MTAKYDVPPMPKDVTPYDWALNQLRVPEAQRVTQGDPNVVIALIDIGYRHHPALDGHLWRNPDPTRGDVRGWDFVNNDDSLEYTGPGEDASMYYRGHHVFVTGEIAAAAPRCPVMILRWGWQRPASLVDAIRYAVKHGAKILVMPHGYLTGNARDGTALFFRGTDFSYPFDNPDLRPALDEAYDAGCLIVKGTADNRGRRVTVANAAFESVLAVGSSNRRGEAADICCSADYVEVAAPGGQRNSDDLRDRIWGYGGDDNEIPFTGGCMASGFAGAVAALVWSRFPQLSNDQVRQILRNTAQSKCWDPMLGWGILDAAKAVSLTDEELQPRLRIDAGQCTFSSRDGQPMLRVRVSNAGALDIRQAVVVAYNGDPSVPAVPEATRENSVILQTSQIGHAMTPVRGLHGAELDICLTESQAGARIWLEAYSLDRHGTNEVARANLLIR
ncbi:MAG: S8 family serine peptidase [Candidatus Pacebacteria bacterium]|nr:S8 family serine peptidase [Candidatus Paceibacterota bacterium]